jgi:VanZ family protein
LPCRNYRESSLSDVLRIYHVHLFELPNAAASVPLRSPLRSALLQNVSRATAWIILAAIVLLTIVPPDLRPITLAPHNVEHAAVFLLGGLAFAVAYRGHALLLSIAALPFCAGLEIAQLFVPGRHARISDFAVDVIAALIGVAAGSIIARKM